MNFLNIKFLISVGIVILIALGGAGFEIWRLNGTIESLAAQLQEAKKEIVIKEANFQIATANLFECNAKIALQNAKLEQIKAQAPDTGEVKERVIMKFEKIKIPVKDAECEKKLKFYEELINEAAK